jgi:hypothetical protein
MCFITERGSWLDSKEELMLVGCLPSMALETSLKEGFQRDSNVVGGLKDITSVLGSDDPLECNGDHSFGW